jgi:phage gp46-like protein
MSFAKNKDILTDIIISLNLAHGTFFYDPTYGHDLGRVKGVNDYNAALLQQYAAQALQHLIDTGKILTMTVIAEVDSSYSNRINLKVTATQSSGAIVQYTTYLGIT